MRQILCFGDSNTWGLDGDSGKRLPWGVRWTSLLQEKLGQQYHVIEEGLCGRTTIFDDPLRDGRRRHRIASDFVGNTCDSGWCCFDAGHERLQNGIWCIGRSDWKRNRAVAPTNPLCCTAGGNPANFSDLSGRQCLETGMRSGIFASIYCCFTASAVGL